MGQGPGHGVEQRAVNLWNLTVSKKTGGSFSHDLNAKLRHVACCLVCACNVRNQDEEASRKKIMMALKTVRAWLDAGDVSLIETPIRIAQQCIEEMRTQLIAQKEERGDSEDLTKKRFALEADLFKLLCYEAEAAVARSSYDLALSLVEQAKSLLEPMPLEGSYLSMLCYNLGLECHQQGEHQSAVVLLRESFEIGKCHQAAAGQKNQARSLRLLATVYLEWDGEKYWKDALNAVNVAQSKHGSSAGLLIKTRALLMGDASDTTLIEGLKELFGHPELTLDVALSALVELGKRSRVTALLESFVDLNQRYSDGSVDLRHRLWACQLELLLQAQRLQEAKTLVEEITSNLRNGSTMEPDMKRRFYGLLWERAAQEAHYAEALEWYNYCLGLNAIQNCSAEMAKLHRNRAACCIASGKLNEATDSLVQAEAFDSVSPFTHFLKFKMAVMQGRVNQATEPIRVMMSFAKSLESSAVTANDLEAKETVNGLLCLSAQIAFEREHHDLAEMALNCVLACNNDPDQQLMGLRCLTRLRLSRAEQSDTPRSCPSMN
ncbi:hypothetical protein CAPTEDRAFT_186155 [Capitella teleta]|uniref:Protein ZIP4 homolog n=1 Tax=Capitella teleta TaxID=283909 RepID=R7UBW7_CAPTE|nr:hypothetical protein CAPTEDRAFT_186155 [Capitella teleta]|eukprot:ELU03601.1 hypothetical protein CAPTEDRAFT_186155 [Capitella teleta]